MYRSDFKIVPPLLNSACPWATSLDDLKALYLSPYTGAVTTRTCLLEGFDHDPQTHQHVFFPSGSSAPRTAARSIVGAEVDSRDLNSGASLTVQDKVSEKTSTGYSSLNTYGYSPHTLSEYLSYLAGILDDTQVHPAAAHDGSSTTPNKLDVPGTKPFIISVTGAPTEVAAAYAMVAAAAENDPRARLWLEVNLSCPNIAGKPPPAYDELSLLDYLENIRDSMASFCGRLGPGREVRVGLKLPPYTYMDQFQMVGRCLRAVTTTSTSTVTQTLAPHSIVSFVTSTNTLGSSLVLDDATLSPTLDSASGTGIGGLAGAAIHHLSCGNVRILRSMLDQEPSTREVAIIGVGGVEDHVGWMRMQSCGADLVACATALGRFGIDVFERIATG